MQRVAAGLDYAHSKGIIHRDLKPDNILFDEAGDAFISDFGIAKLSSSQTNLTAGRIVGTPTYMSPEQGQGDEIDSRSDIYSIGVILYEMLSGKPPYKADTPIGLVYKHVSEPIPHILDIKPELPTSVEAVLERALAKKPADRFSTAMDLANAIVAISHGETPDLDTTRPIPTHIHKRTEIKGQPAPAAAQKQPPSFGKVLSSVIGLALTALVFLAGIRFAMQLTATPTPSPSPAVPVSLSAPTATATETATPTPTSTPTASPTPAPTLTATMIPGIGGADKIALLMNSDIWMVGVDGSGLFQLLNDDKEKFDLQWLPGGKDISFIKKGCLYVVNLVDRKETKVACYGTPYFEGFQVSPDGKWAAFAIERRLLVVPFNLEKISLTYTRSDLENLEDSCLVYTAVVAKGVRWSADSRKLAVLFQSAKDGRMADFVRIMDVSRCYDADPLVLDDFPSKRSAPPEYTDNPALSSYSWDGDQRFLINTFKRNDGYGELYLYDMSTGEFRKINPIGGTCCYRDASFSPDGKYILFAFQDLRLGEDSETQLYYIPFDAIGTGAKFTPIKIPRTFFSNLREKIQPVLRPSIP